AGSTVMAMLGAANRDPQVFAEPDQFSVERTSSSMHLAFGRGMHSCLGAQLARLETRVVLRTLFGRHVEIKLLPDLPPERRVAAQMLNLRALRSLPISLTPATAALAEDMHK